MAAPTKWRWDASNGNATAEETAAAYHALTHPRSEDGKTSAFKSVVWDDIIQKISSQRQYWGGTEWEESVATLYDSLMAADHNMTAKRFNSAVANISHTNYVWSWIERLKRKEIQPGDICMGDYFLSLVEGLNYWIDLIPLDVIAALQAAYNGEINTSLLVSKPVKPAEFVFELAQLADIKSLQALGIKAEDEYKITLTLSADCVSINNVICALFFLTTFSTTAKSDAAKHAVASMLSKIILSTAAQVDASVSAKFMTDILFSTSCTARTKPADHTGGIIVLNYVDEATVNVGYSVPIKPQYLGHTFITSCKAFAPFGRSLAAQLALHAQQSVKAVLPLGIPFAYSNMSSLTVSAETSAPVSMPLLVDFSALFSGAGLITNTAADALQIETESAMSVSCGFSMGVPTLAIELDYNFVGDLDDMLVDNVEYRII